jgi:DNA-binding NarL/FixJ family response regulator
LKVSTPLRLLLVADHFVIRVGLGSLINSQFDMVVTAEGTSTLEAVELYARHHPDVVLLELRRREGEGAECAAALCRRFPEARVIVLVAADDGVTPARASAAGACACLLDDLDRKELLEAIRALRVAPCS